MSTSLVILPTYNEKENIELMVRAIFNLREGFEILVVDDNSPDGTTDIVRSLQTQYQDMLFLESRKGKSGLGTAYIHGFKWAIEKKYDFIFEMDCDFSHDPKDLIRLRDACEFGNYDLAVGSRYIKGVNVVNWPMSRVLMSYFAGVYVRLVTGMKIKDSTAGFKCYRREVLESIRFDKIQFVGYAFQIEMKFTVWRLGYKIIEVPIIFTERTRGSSKMSTKIFREAFLGVMYLKLMSYFRRYKRESLKFKV